MTPMPLIHGYMISCRPISLSKMTDEAGDDIKIMDVLLDYVSEFHSNVNSYTDVQPVLLDQNTHFSNTIKDLKLGK